MLPARAPMSRLVRASGCVAFAVVVTLSACTPVTLTARDVGPSPSESDTEPGSISPSPSETPAATPSNSATPLNSAAALPAACSAVVDAAAYDGIFLNTPLNDPGFVDSSLVGVIEPVAPPAGATATQIVASAVELRCIWRDPGADVTGISIEYSRVDPADAALYVSELAAEGHTCTDANGGRQCQLVKPNEQYPVDEGYTALARDGIVIVVQQANFPTNGLMGQLAATVWAD